MKKSIWRKIGWFLIALMPAAGSLLLQFCAGIFWMFCIAIWTGYQNAGAKISNSQLVEMTQENYMSHVIYAIILYQLLALLILGIWYYCAYGRKPRPQNIEKAGTKEILIIILSGALIQVFVSGILGMIYLLLPDLLSGYTEMMQESGITEGTLTALFSTVILAPLGEELLCRGVTLRLAEKVSDRFWVANCIQALAFGLIHANWVQGIYAFGIGLVLGYLYGKYRNIWLCMLLHASLNLSSNYVDSLWALLPEQGVIVQLLMICCLCLACLAMCYRILEKRKTI
jgi:membrane protease YdiL (CAAX protease family)